MRNLSDAGLNLIKTSEGFRGKVYLDGVGIPTVGYGHKLLHTEFFPNGITEGQATALLHSDVQDAVQSANRLIKVDVTQGIFDAVTDLIYNTGSGRVASSTLLQLLNASKPDEACDQLYYEDASGGKHGWIYAGGKIEPGLIVRRKAEQALWRSV